MRPALLLLAVVLAAAVAACGASAAGRTPIVFGVTGGNVIGYRVTIQPNGSVRVRGSRRTVRRQIRPARVRQLRREIQHANLATSTCVGSLPDFATRFIRLGDRQFAVRGECEVPFNHVFNDLEKTVASRARPR
jgi:hypothetical protein